MEKMLGIMIDCSRSAVMSVETVKEYADIVGKMGYNTIMLYTEDTYEVDNQPLFGHLRGRYSKAELKEIDEYCSSIGIEVIPCIQTLAHLEAIFRWTKYNDVNDCDNILLAGEEKTYELIEDMISSLSQCFRTDKIHIGMDEAYRVGTGEYQRRHGIEDRFDIINNHLHRVCEIAKKYNYEPMVWSDMFCKLAFNIKSQYDTVDASKILEKAKLPENISLVYWDYYSTDYDHYISQIKTNKLFGRKVYFAGGAWTWRGFTPENEFSIKATEKALAACRDDGVDGVFLTMWGDNGAECSKYAVLPSLMYAAEAYRGNFDMEDIKAKFKEIVGSDFDSFMLLDKLSTPGGKHTEGAHKYLLYNDCFLGINDWRCDVSDGEYYEKLEKELERVVYDSRYAKMFKFYRCLANVLAIKAPLGIKTRKVYLSDDKAELTGIVAEYEELLVKLDEFHRAFRKHWFEENKPHGFDTHDIRLGGLMTRVKSCKERLEQYISGEIQSIPELEEPVIESVINRPVFWPNTASPNSIAGI